MLLSDDPGKMSRLFPSLFDRPRGQIMIKPNLQSRCLCFAVIALEVGIYSPGSLARLNIDDTYTGTAHLEKINPAFPMTDIDSF